MKRFYKLSKASSRVYRNPIVYKNGQFYLFGGDGAESVIAKLDVTTKTWTQVGSLNQGRYGHAVVVRSNDFIIVGGRNTRNTERCSLRNEMQIVCVSVEPELTDFAVYPEAMLVDENFCVNN